MPDLDAKADEMLIDVLLHLKTRGVPADILEVLTHGDGRGTVAPGALKAALSALPSDGREQVDENFIRQFLRDNDFDEFEHPAGSSSTAYVKSQQDRLTALLTKFLSFADKARALTRHAGDTGKGEAT